MGLCTIRMAFGYSFKNIFLSLNTAPEKILIFSRKSLIAKCLNLKIHKISVYRKQPRIIT